MAKMLECSIRIRRQPTAESKNYACKKVATKKLLSLSALSASIRFGNDKVASPSTPLESVRFRSTAWSTEPAHYLLLLLLLLLLIYKAQILTYRCRVRYFDDLWRYHH